MENKTLSKTLPDSSASKAVVAEAESAPLTKALMLDYLRQQGADLTENETAMFCAVALSFGLNPFKREIYAIPYGKGDKRRLSIITGYESYIKRAERSGLLDSWSVKAEGKFKKVKIQKSGYNGNYTVDARVPDGEVTATCTIYRKGSDHPFEWTVDFDEYDQGNEMWRSKPLTMIKKVAIAQAFRLAFPDEIGGMPYTSDELPDNMTEVRVENTRADAGEGVLPVRNTNAPTARTSARNISAGDAANPPRPAELVTAGSPSEKEENGERKKSPRSPEADGAAIDAGALGGGFAPEVPEDIAFDGAKMAPTPKTPREMFLEKMAGLAKQFGADYVDALGNIGYDRAEDVLDDKATMGNVFRAVKGALK